MVPILNGIGTDVACVGVRAQPFSFSFVQGFI